MSVPENIQTPDGFLLDIANTNYNERMQLLSELASQMTPSTHYSRSFIDKLAYTLYRLGYLIIRTNELERSEILPLNIESNKKTMDRKTTILNIIKKMPISEKGEVLSAKVLIHCFTRGLLNAFDHKRAVSRTQMEEYLKNICYMCVKPKRIIDRDLLRQISPHPM